MNKYERLKAGYLIANNHSFEKGWTKQIFGRAVRAEFGGQAKEL